MKEITLETKIADLLNNYDGMKDILININPKFKKLNNPILRRTLAKVASVKQAAIVGGMDANDLLNQLRVAVGQTPIDITDTNDNQESNNLKEAPEWTLQKAQLELDANQLLDDNKNPLAEINKALRTINKDEVIILKSDFMPEPLIEEVEKLKHKTYAEKIDDNIFITFIKKS